MESKALASHLVMVRYTQDLLSVHKHKTPNSKNTTGRILFPYPCSGIMLSNRRGDEGFEHTQAIRTEFRVEGAEVFSGEAISRCVVLLCGHLSVERKDQIQRCSDCFGFHLWSCCAPQSLESSGGKAYVVVTDGNNRMEEISFTSIACQHLQMCRILTNNGRVPSNHQLSLLERPSLS